MQTDFSYYMNAFLYCLWLYEKKSAQAFDKFSDRLFSLAAKYLLTKKYQKRYHTSQENAEIVIQKCMNDKKNGLNISLAGNTLGTIYSEYPCFVSFTTLGILMRLYGNVAPGVLIILFVVPIGLAYIPAYNAVFKKDKYLAYFKQFEKEDEQWHKKWKRKTMLFCLGGIVSFISGIIGAILIITH